MLMTSEKKFNMFFFGCVFSTNVFGENFLHLCLGLLLKGKFPDNCTNPNMTNVCEGHPNSLVTLLYYYCYIIVTLLLTLYRIMISLDKFQYSLFYY